MFKIFKTIVVVQVFLSIGARAQAISDLIDTKLDPKSSEMIFARSNLSNIEIGKLAYTATMHEANLNWAQKQYRTVDEQRSAVARLDAEAKKVVDGESFRGQWLESVAKDTVDAASKVGAKRGVIIPTRTLYLGIEKGLDWMGSAPMRVDMNPQAQAEIVASVLHAYQDPNHPRHAEAEELVKTRLPNLQSGQSLEFRPEVVGERRHDSLLWTLHEMQRQGQDTRAFVKQNFDKLNSEIQQQAGDALATVSEVQLTLNDIRNEQLEKQKRDERMQDFQAASGVLSSLGEAGRLIGMPPDDIYRIDQASKLVNLIGQADQLVGSIAENPIMYTNVYLAIAVTAANLIMGSQKDSTATILEALQKIAEQIEAMRKQMHERFDALDHKLNRYFEVSLADLSNIQSIVEENRNLLVQSLNETRALNQTVRQGINFLWMDRFTDKLSHCLGRDSESKAFVLSEVEMLTCRNSFASLAASDWDLSQLEEGPNVSMQAQLGKSYVDLRNELTAAGGSKTVNMGNPGTWMLGTRLFLNFFKLHPDQIGLAQEAHVSVDTKAFDPSRLQLSSLIERGRAFSESLRSLALRPEGERFVLNRSVFAYLIKQYEDDLQSAMTTAQERVDSVSGVGPKVNQDLEKQTPKMNDHLESFTRPLEYCGVLEGKKDPPSAYYENPANAANGVPEYMTRFHPSTTKLRPAVASVLPNSLLWMYRENFEGLNLVPCVRVVRVTAAEQISSFVWLEEFNIVFDVLEIHKNEDGKVETQILASIDFNGIVSPADRNDNYTPWNNWNGWWDKFAANPSRYYRLASSPETEKNLNRLVERYKRKLAEKQAKGDVNLLSQMQLQSHHAREKLQLVLLLGLDQRNLVVGDLVSRIISDEMLPEPATIAEMHYKGQIPEEELRKAMNRRITSIKRLVDQLAEAPGLRPRSDEIDVLVAQLEKMEQGTSGLCRYAPLFCRN